MPGSDATRLLLTFVSAVLAAALLGACGGSGSDGGSDQFRDQTKSAILDFGEEGSEATLDEAAEAVEEFLASRAEEDWPATCGQLSRSLSDKIQHLATSATELEDKSCPAFLAAFTRLSARERREGTVIDAGSLREQGKSAFLIYYGGDEVVYAMPLSREGNGWKVDSLAPQRLS